MSRLTDLADAVVAALNAAPGVSWATYRDSMISIWQSCRRYGIVPIMTTITQYQTESASAYKGAIRAWNERLKELCADQQVCLVDLWEVLKDTTDNDQIRAAFRYGAEDRHLSAEGYRACATAISQSVVGQ